MLSFINSHYIFQKKIMDKSWCHHDFEDLYHRRHPMMLKYFHTADLAFNCFPSPLSKYWCSCFLFTDNDDDVNFWTMTIMMMILFSKQWKIVSFFILNNLWIILKEGQMFWIMMPLIITTRLLHDFQDSKFSLKLIFLTNKEKAIWAGF